MVILFQIIQLLSLRLVFIKVNLYRTHHLLCGLAGRTRAKSVVYAAVRLLLMASTIVSLVEMKQGGERLRLLHQCGGLAWRLSVDIVAALLCIGLVAHTSAKNHPFCLSMVPARRECRICGCDSCQLQRGKVQRQRGILLQLVAQISSLSLMVQDVGLLRMLNIESLTEPLILRRQDLIISGELLGCPAAHQE